MNSRARQVSPAAYPLPAAVDPPAPGDSYRVLIRQATVLAAPAMLEHLLHLLVGVTDTYMANHLKQDAAAGAAAVGTISYFLWLIGLIVTAIGTGATAIIARAIGARHRSLANSVCGQSITAAVLLGLGMGVLVYLFAEPLIGVTGLSGQAPEFALSYLRLLAFSIPFTMVMLVANSCLRGAGDTLTPAVSMVLVDLLNIFFTYALTMGAFGFPELGFHGIAAGTVIGYTVGGVLQFMVLVAGRGGIRLHIHRMRPHWLTVKRIARIGLPSGAESLLNWIAQFAVIHFINAMDATNRVPTAHTNAVRIEGFSYMLGFGVSLAAATMVGQALGAGNARRATRAAYVCYGLGGGIMILMGLVFIFFGEYPSRWMAADEHIAHLTTQCLFIAGFIQAGFAAAIIFSGVLRGAGDTLWVMLLNLASIVIVRLGGVLIAAIYFKASLPAIWVILCVELMVRGSLLYGRFLHGGWRKVRV